MAFYESPRFPLFLVAGAGGGPEFSTDVVEVRSGFEVRNINWSASRRRFNGAMGAKTIADYESLLKFFNTMRGRAHGFRYKDWADYKSCDIGSTVANTDQLIGVGTGAALTFQLAKTYTSGAQTYAHTIKKPVTGTVVVAVNGVSSAVWTVNTTTGVVTFNGGSAPGNGLSVTAGFEYDVPCRFDIDFLDLSFITDRIGTIDAQLVEIRV